MKTKTFELDMFSYLDMLFKAIFSLVLNLISNMRGSIDNTRNEIFT